MDSEFTRDIQIANIPEADKGDTENWSDYENDVVVGFYFADNEGEAIGSAALDIHVSGEMLKAYPLK